MKKLVVLTGAGMSAESGIQTFRDANGLWEGHDVMEVASPQGFKNNPRTSFRFLQSKKKTIINRKTKQSTFQFKRIRKRLSCNYNYTKCR